MANVTDCTSNDCSRTFLTYKPPLGGNAALLALFAILIPVAVGLGIRYRSSVYSTAIATGLAFEVLGYIGRLLLHFNPNDRGAFILFLLGTILGPTCICGAIFTVMPRIVAIYGEEYRTWRPVWYLYVFYAFTVVCVILQLAGVIIPTVQDGSYMIDMGIRILVVGLVIQIIALAVFIFHAVLFAIAVRTRHHHLDMKYAHVYESLIFRVFLFAFSFATFLIVLRTAFRIVAVAEGFDSQVAQDEVLVQVLDGVMILLATITLLVFFPARAFGQCWSQISARHLTQTPPRPSRPTPVQLLPSKQPSLPYEPPLSYNRMNISSPVASPSPNKPRYPPPTQRRNMVDSDSLW
ncbi:RTA1 like protein-domain-containing protein [Xylariomycetidae sp. FL2044]|nr:RTA1 like protein-domain-containing protein [Xylariomycetidae sp. FL2044]